MAFTIVALIADLEPNQMKAVSANGKPILLTNLKGIFYAIGNKCTHMQCSLSNGMLKGEEILCPCHGSRFNVKTGKVVAGLAVIDEPVYDLKIESGKILVDV